MHVAPFHHYQLLHTTCEPSTTKCRKSQTYKSRQKSETVSSYHGFVLLLSFMHTSFTHVEWTSSFPVQIKHIHTPIPTDISPSIPTVIYSHPSRLYHQHSTIIGLYISADLWCRPSNGITCAHMLRSHIPSAPIWMPFSLKTSSHLAHYHTSHHIDAYPPCAGILPSLWTSRFDRFLIFNLSTNQSLFDPRPGIRQTSYPSCIICRTTIKYFPPSLIITTIRNYVRSCHVVNIVSLIFYPKHTPCAISRPLPKSSAHAHISCPPRAYIRRWTASAQSILSSHWMLVVIPLA